MATYLFDVVEDTDHIEHVLSDMERETDAGQRGYYQEELDALLDGTYAAYGTVLVKVCDCCGHGERDYSHALWGTVIHPVATGRYALDELADERLRSIARELLSEVGA